MVTKKSTLSNKQIEDKIMKFWEEKKIYEKTKRSRKKAKKFYFLDGPPYATGSIHIGTAMNKVLKDSYIRFFRMLGFNVWDQPGYDTHGVPIENKIEKQLNFKSKKDIEKFGVEKFVKKCREFATQFIGVMGKQFNNLGVWMDWDNPYLTLNNDYIEGAWFTFKKAFEKGFLYKGVYSVHVCPHCESVVAYNEINYAQTTDPSIYVKFKVRGKNEYIVIWTTTPWTLPANTGVMVHPREKYIRVEANGEILIIGEKLLKTVMEKIGIKEYKIIETILGKELEGLQYEHPLTEIFQFQKTLKNAHRIVLSEQFVTMDEGTGLVHIAPGHGQEDYKVGVEEGLPIVSPVNMDGTFDETCGKYSGIFVKDADKLIVEYLKKHGLLLHEEKITHEYPFCWRCNSPLLMLAVPQWFFKVSSIRDKLIEENKKINWTPSWAGQRFHNWLENLGDWPISRQRYWGIPLPIWVCEKCGKVKVIGSRKELPKVPKDFHKPYIDEIFFKCKCGGKMKRVPDILDVWFDSGVCSWASLGYPKNKKLFNKLWPADFILEGPDQIRGWWNSLMITSIMTFGRRPFENVLFHGFVLDAHGKQMSKSLGNIIQPEEVIKKYGRDILRLYYLSSAPWDDYYFKWSEVEDLAKKFLIIKNTFNFVKTYATRFKKPKRLNVEDKWILSRLNMLIDNCTKHFKTFSSYKAVKEMEDFILNDFSRWYVKIIRDRVWSEYRGKDKAAALYTLLTVTENLAVLLAPVCPFFAEHVYQNIVKSLKRGKQSVHMLNWPKPNKKLMDKELEEQMNIVKNIVEACSKARQSADIRLRWPVKRIFVLSEDKKVKDAVKKLENVLLMMCNTKRVEVFHRKPVGDFSEASFALGKVLVDRVLDKNLLDEALIRELIREVQSLRKKHSFVVKERIVLSLDSDRETKRTLRKYKSTLKREVGARKILIGKLKGKYKGTLKFKEKQIEVSFDKLTR